VDERILDPDAAQERLKAWKDEIEQVAANTAALSERLQALRVTARDRMAEVTVDSTGKLVELRLTEEIHRAAPDVVARTIMATLRDAQGRLASRTGEIVNGTVGPSSTTGQAIEAGYSAPTGQGEPTGHGSQFGHGTPTSQGGPRHSSPTGQSHGSSAGQPAAASPPPRRPRPPAEDEVDVSVTDSSPAQPAYRPPPRPQRAAVDDDDFSVSVTEEG
jgi:DNA-binding protein YbaB